MDRASTSTRSEISFTNSLYAGSTGRPIVVSGISPSIGPFETISILTVLWLGPLLSSSLTATAPSLLSSQIAGNVLNVILSYVVGAVLLSVFTELFYYYSDQCGGLYTVCKKLSCHSLCHVILSVSLLTCVLHVGIAMIDLSMYLDRVSQFSIADWQNNWSNSRVDVVAILLLLPLIVCTLFFVYGSGKICIGLSVAVVASIMCATGYSIKHGLVYHELQTTLTITNGSYTTVLVRDNSTFDYKIMSNNFVRDALDDDTAKLKYFLGQIMLITSPLLVPALLSALSEDCKMKRHHALITGVATYATMMVIQLVFSVSVSHIISNNPVYMDQLLLTIGVPEVLTLIITIITSVTLFIRAVLILACVCRVMLGVAMFKEEEGQTGRFCTILRIPIVINSCIIILCAAIITCNGTDVRSMALVMIFCFVMCGNIVHVLHRYIMEELSETTPIVGNFGSLKPHKVVRYLLGVLILSACLLWISELLDGFLEDVHELSLAWTVVQITFVLMVVGSISVIASLKQTTVDKPFRLIWTPALPTVSIMICTCVMVINWMYGIIMCGCVLMLTVLVWLYDKLLRSCCCSVNVDNQ